jgi:hypothetical protein
MLSTHAHTPQMTTMMMMVVVVKERMRGEGKYEKINKLLALDLIWCDVMLMFCAYLIDASLCRQNAICMRACRRLIKLVNISAHDGFIYRGVKSLFSLLEI